MWQSLYATKFIQTSFIRNKIYTGQSLYSNNIYTQQNLYGNKIYTNFIYTVTKFIHNKIYTKHYLYRNKIETWLSLGFFVTIYIHSSKIIEDCICLHLKMDIHHVYPR